MKVALLGVVPSFFFVVRKYNNRNGQLTSSKATSLPKKKKFNKNKEKLNEKKFLRSHSNSSFTSGESNDKSNEEDKNISNKARAKKDKSGNFSKRESKQGKDIENIKDTFSGCKKQNNSKSDAESISSETMSELSDEFVFKINNANIDNEINNNGNKIKTEEGNKQSSQYQQQHSLYEVGCFRKTMMPNSFPPYLPKDSLIPGISLIF
jgi:hypothetical protein